MFKLILITTVFFAISQTAIESAVLPTYDGHSNTSLTIINGKEVKPHAAPYIAAINILLEDKRESFCGGSLISPKYILTAAHCLVNGIKAHVVLGAHNRFENEATQYHLRIESRSNFIIHKGYKHPDHKHDIALLLLPVPVGQNKYISYVKLPKMADAKKLYESDIGVALGWGDTDDKENDSDVLRGVTVFVISNKKCKKKYPLIYSGNICTSGDKIFRTCRGDSGGPFVIKDRLVGVISYGSATCVSQTPSVFISTGQYLKWIKENSDAVIE